jgi:hypothetical protein
MKSNLKPVVLLLCCGMLFVAGCHEKKKPALPPQASAPPANTQPPPFQPQPEVKPQEPSTTNQEPAQTEQKPSPATPKHPKPHAVARKPTPKPPTTEKPPEVAVNTPPRIIIQEGGTDNSSSGRIAPLNSHTEAAHNQATTDQLLDSTENNLRAIKRQLSADEQAQVKQIRDFMSQARQAIKDSDSVRAHNLALKAHLLSDDLVRQK